MKREDWTGVSISLGVHVLVLLLLSVLTTAATQETMIGFMEVDFGPISDGRAVQQAPETPRQESQELKEEEIEQEQAATSPPEEAKPVELPDQAEEIIDEEIIEAPETEVIAPAESKTLQEEEAPEPEPEKEVVKPLGSGSLSADDASDSGDDGTSNESEKTSPYRIEGLNRSPISTPIPAYTVQVDAFIQVQIEVDPQGRIVRRIPRIKGDPTLERAVMDALLRWRFNPLPAEAPQENQIGLVSFRFSRH